MVQELYKGLSHKEMRRVFLAGDEHFYVVEGVDEIGSLTDTLTTEDLVLLFH